MKRTGFPKMKKESGSHEESNTDGTKADNFQIVIEQHDGKGKFKNSHQVADPFRKFERFKLVLDVVVTHYPYE